MANPPLFMQQPQQQAPLPPGFPFLKPGALDPPSSIAAPTLPVIPPAPRPPEVDYQTMINNLFGSPPDFNAEAQQQLQGIYDPQYQAITNKEGLAKQNASKQDAKIEAMYRALQGDIGGSQKNIDSAYGQAVSGTNKAYQQGKAGIQGNYQTANNSLATMMRSLGLDAAAPDVLSQGANQSAFLQSLLDATNQGASNLLTANKQSASDFNTAQKNIAGLTDTERRSDLQNALMARLSSLDDQSLALGSQEAQQKANFIQQLQQNWTGQQEQQANSLMQQMQWDQQMRSQADQTDYQRVQDAIKAQQSGGFGGDLSPKDQWSMMGPGEKGYATAARMLGPDLGAKAMNLIMQVGGSRQFTNGFEFAQAVAQANQAAAQHNAADAIPPNQLQALASQMYSEIDPRSPSYLQYLNQQ